MAAFPADPAWIVWGSSAGTAKVGVFEESVEPAAEAEAAAALPCC